MYGYMYEYIQISVWSDLSVGTEVTSTPQSYLRLVDGAPAQRVVRTILYHECPDPAAAYPSRPSDLLMDLLPYPTTAVHVRPALNVLFRSGYFKTEYFTPEVFHSE